jgi:crotonobetainyl-CoA:carnitine CoA-transferase CaiB-like acyl-CoA transferase
MSLPLAGVRIAVVESFGAGPYGSMFLADLGAEVIKLENPATGGDASRSVGPHFLGEKGDSHYFQTFNRNKKSVAVNLKNPAGQELLHKLVGRCDAILNNLRGDLPQKLGLDFASLKLANPSIVCVHLSAYGRENERKARPGYDYLMQAEAGFMSVTGEPGDPPSRMGLSIVDSISGLTGAVGLLAAVIGARESGRGCDVDSCLFDVALHQLSYPATWYLNEGTETKRMVRSAHPFIAPAQLFTTADGWIMIMCMKDKFWHNLLETMDRMDLATDPRFASAEGRRRNLPDLSAVLDQEFSTFTTANWVEKLATRLPAAPVYDIAEALENPFVEATGMLENISHPDRSDFRMLANPLRINGQRLPGKVCSKLGQDTASILEMLGIPAEQHGNGMADEA